MSITTYAELQSSVADWLAREDLTAQIKTFIQLTEKRFSRENAVAQMETQSAALTPVNGSVPLPSDLSQIRDVILNTNPVRVLRNTPFQHAMGRVPTSGSTPDSYYISGANLVLSPASSGNTVSIWYYANVPALSDTNATNWLLTGFPDIYLFGTLREAQHLLQNDARLQTWEALYSKALDGMIRSDVGLRWGMGRMMPTGPAP